MPQTPKKPAFRERMLADPRSRVSTHIEDRRNTGKAPLDSAGYGDLLGGEYGGTMNPDLAQPVPIYPEEDPTLISPEDARVVLNRALSAVIPPKVVSRRKPVIHYPRPRR